ncbi:MAG TPA: diaminopimelate decarboxylase [Candidatus Binatia bacterium]|nr:diaminopimelate decarboxylase [Candidatus Binatia bacterium]
MPWEGALAPGQTRDPNGNLTIGSILARRLAERYGTPLLVVNLGVVDAALDALEGCTRPLDVGVSYAAKAFATIEFVRYLARRGIGLDVCSLGELVTAERAGFPPERVTLHGAGKSDDELVAVCRGRAGCVVVDGIEELARLARLSRDAGPVDVLLRLNVGIEAHTHEFLRTGGDDTKFGIHQRDEPLAADLLRASSGLRFVGLHAHVGSQIYESSPYVAAAHELVSAARRFAGAGLPARRVVIGGGFGVQTRPGERAESLDVGATLRAATERVTKDARRYGIPAPRLEIEPGRAVVGPAGTTLYRVLAVKRQTRRTFVVVDGGVAENPRPALYGAYHHVVPAAAPSDDVAEVTLCGRSCENDELGIVRLPCGVRDGDLLAMCTTGAYTYSMAGNYNRFPRPAVVAVADGSERLLARRESIDDVLRNDA